MSKRVRALHCATDGFNSQEVFKVKKTEIAICLTEIADFLMIIQSSIIADSENYQFTPYSEFTLQGRVSQYIFI
jgi:hypothetical protein